MNKEYINTKKAFKESKSKILQGLPNFAVSLMAAIIREKEINRVLNKYSDYEGVEFIAKMREELNLKLDIRGLENLPENGKCFFVGNHPFGFVDGITLTNIVSSKYGNFKAIGNETFMLIPQIHNVVAAVNVFGSNPRQYLLELDKVYKSDIPITHFPAGLVSRIRKWKIRDSEWQKSMITKAVSCQRDIVPFHFSGRNSRLFYFIFLMRKVFGIKVNLELALLPHEIFNKRNKTIKVTIGKPVPYTAFDNSYSHFEWAQKLKDHLYTLKDNPKQTFTQ